MIWGLQIRALRFQHAELFFLSLAKGGLAISLARFCPESQSGLLTRLITWDHLEAVQSEEQSDFLQPRGPGH